MYRHNTAARGGSRPPSAPPTNAGTKRKERDYEQEAGDETNINVVVRCRGRNEREVRENSGIVVETTGVKGNAVDLSMGPNAVSNKTYHFDKVFSPAAEQATIFNDVVSPILSEMLGGYNCTIFAYGQTGTGKTYTMSGDMTESCGLLTDGAGIIPRVLQSLFQKLEAEETECSVKCSFIELYNEELRDLLSADDSVKLKIYDDNSKKGHSATLVQGMEESHITSAAGGIKLLQQGSHRRQVAATKCNDLSSRSHTVFTITTYVKKPAESTEDYICSGKLNLVDLAGSENIQRSGAENKRAAEAGLINKSLLTLGRVINALVDKSAHIPYRESKLTRLLQDSLGGRTKTCIIATISPARSNLEETISTLDYAFRAKNIRNKPQINSMISKKTLLREFTTEIEKLKSELIATRQRNGIYLSNEEYQEVESRRILCQEQEVRIETMEANLRNKVQELFSLTNSFTSLKKDNESTRMTLEATKDVLQKTEIVLSHTRQDLDEESRLRERYAKTESDLHNVGNELLSTIGASLRDIDGLHAKLKRRSVLHAQNQQRWETTRNQGRGTLKAVDDSLEVIEQEHSTALEAASERIRSFVSAELSRTSRAHSILDEGLANLTHKVHAHETQTSAARDTMNDVLEEIKVLRDNVKSKVGEGLNGLSDAAARISGEVISELDQFHTQLFTSYSGLGKEIKATFDDLSKQLAAQREESDRLRKALQEANRKNMEASLSAASQLEAAIDAERSASENDREQLMQQMASLVNEAARKRDERLNAQLTLTQTAIVEATEQFEIADRVYAEGMDQWNEDDSALRGKIVKSKEETKNRFKKDWAAVGDRNTRIQESTKAVHKETVKIVDAQVQDMATQMAALDGFVARAREQNDGHHKEHIASLEEMSTQLRRSFENAQNCLSSSSIETFNTGIKAHLDEVSSTFADINDMARDPIQHLQQGLGDTVMRDYIPTGQTPQRRDWSYPKSLPRTIALPLSTTPTGKPPASNSLSRTLSTKSSRELLSPRKSPRKQIVRADTPPSSSTEGHSHLPKIPNEAETKPTTHLKEVDLNILPSTAAHKQPSLTKPDDSSTTSSTLTSDDPKVSTVTTTSRLPTKRSDLSRTNSLTDGPTSAAEKLEKENIPVLTAKEVAVAKESIVPAPVYEKGRTSKMAQSFYVPRMTRSSTAAVKRGTLGGTEFGGSVNG